jgi:hypothetical protein
VRLLARRCHSICRLKVANEGAEVAAGSFGRDFGGFGGFIGGGGTIMVTFPFLCRRRSLSLLFLEGY